MDTLQTELQTTYSLLRIQLLGINQRGQEPGNEATTEGRGLPWLQDVDTDGNYLSDVARDLWDLTYRDLVILDGDNTQVGVFNLDDHNLADSENYATLREMLVDAAMQSQLPWRNSDNALDVDNNGVVVPLDALIVVNELNSAGNYRLPPPVDEQSAPPYYDCSGDGDLTPLDALLVVNFLNDQSVAAAGEGEPDSVSGLLSAGQPGAIPSVGPQTASSGADATTVPVDFGRPSISTEEVQTPRDTPLPEAIDSILADWPLGDAVERAVPTDSDLPMMDDRLEPLSTEPATVAKSRG